MWNAGAIGNLGVIQALGQLVTMKANQYLPKGQKPYGLKDFIPNSMDFFEPPQTEEEKKAALDFGLAMVGQIPPGLMLDSIKAAEKKRGH